MKKRKAQGILEYVVVLTAIIAVIIFAATNLIRPSATGIYEETTAVIDSAAAKMGSAALEGGE